MKIDKKNCLGIGLAVIIAVFSQLIPVIKVSAAGGVINGEGEWRQAQYELSAKSSIKVTLAGGDHDPIYFTDSSPNDTTHNYTADTNGTGVCKGSITFKNGQGFNNKPILANINVTYQSSSSSTSSSCNISPPTYSPGGGISIINNTSNGGQTPAPTGPNTVTFNGNTYSQINGTRAYGLKTDVSSCYGGEIIVLNSVPTGGNSVKGTVLPTGLNVGGSQELSKQVSNFPNIPLNVASVGRCYYNSNSNGSNNILLTVAPDGTATFAGCSKGGTACKPDPAGSNNTDPAATQTTCEANSNGFSFAWAVCPMLDAASKLTDTLLGYFEDQLSFNVAQLGSSGSQVQHSWSLIKDVCSALVVLIMLLMVVSQAVSIGPFDAYTIRKLLPRLIAVVILMQISWNLFAYVIQLVNDLARGIADIMYLPFGGPQNMGLFNLLGHANLGGVELGVLNWAAIGVGVALGIAFLFTMLGVAFTAIVALLFAMLTLVFRKILIIVLLIFSPLALLAWILPGTERYWKMWRENFFKVLFMFPLLVAIIAAGRVFAYIVGTQNNGEFLNLIFILVGFFGPLFLAPRTFKWGGQAMQMAGNGIMKASEKVSERPKKLLDTRQESWRQLRRNKSASRIGTYLTDRNSKDPTRKPSFGRKAGLFMRGDLFRAGILDPTLGIPMKVPTFKDGKLSTKRIGSERRNSQEAEFINAKEEISSQEAGKFGRMIDAETRGFGNDKKAIVEYLKRRLQNTNPEEDGTLQWVLQDRLATFKESDYMHLLAEKERRVQSGDNSKMLDNDGLEVPLVNFKANAAGMYDKLKALDPSIVQGDFNVADNVLAGMTGAAWARLSSANPEVAAQKFDDIMRSPLRGNLDPGALSAIVQNSTDETVRDLAIKYNYKTGVNQTLKTILDDYEKEPVKAADGSVVLDERGQVKLQYKLDESGQRIERKALKQFTANHPSMRARMEALIREGRDPIEAFGTAAPDTSDSPSTTTPTRDADTSTTVQSQQQEVANMAEAIARGVAQGQRSTYNPTTGVSTGGFQGEINIHPGNPSPPTGETGESPQSDNPNQ